MTTSYDRVAYPALVFLHTHPERLAVMAALAGLDPVPPAEARVLDIGGGDCVNLMAIAAAYPGCDAHGFDLSEAAIGRGQTLARAAGFANVTLAVEDIMAAHRRYPARSCDYIIAHGVYAWVPPAVREALMAFIGHALSERGVAFVSYNCMPGGHVRLILREMLLDALDGIDDPAERVAAARAFLESYAAPRAGEDALFVAVREQAASMLERPDALLFHDELGDAYHPQRFLDVVRHGEANGLRFLTDSGRNRLLDGFLTEDPPEGVGAADFDALDAAVLRTATLDDYQAMRFFRHTLFVRAEQRPDRLIDPDRFARLLVTTRMQRQADGSFQHKGASVTLADPQLADALERVAAQHPLRQPVSAVATNPQQLMALLMLFSQGDVTLHVGPTPFPLKPGAYPQSSPLVRAMIADGAEKLCTLENMFMRIDHEPTRALLMAADGTRTLAEVAAAGHGIPPDEVEAALTAAAVRGLMAG